MRIGSLVASVTLGVEGCEGGTDEVWDLDRSWMESNRRWESRTGMANIRDDDPIGTVPTLGGGGGVDCGETPGRAYTIEGTTGATTKGMSENSRNDSG